MGRTGNLREYLSSVSTTIVNNSGDKTKDPFDALKSFIGNKNNIEAISVTDANGTIETIPYNGQEEIELPNLESPFTQKAVHFKDHITIYLNDETPAFLYTKDNKVIGISPVEGGEGITCKSQDEQDYGWTITFLLD